MDLDQTCAGQQPPPRGCFLCGDPGHIKRDCPRRIEVQQLDTDELEEELARRRDEAELLRHHQEVADSEARTEEDFGNPSP